MTKEDFKLEYENLTEKMSEIHKSRMVLEKKYIELNKPFNIGDRIYSQKENSFGYVIDFKLDYDRNVKPIALKEKKDGSRSKISLYIYCSKDVILSPKKITL